MNKDKLELVFTVLFIILLYAAVFLGLLVAALA